MISVPVIFLSLYSFSRNFSWSPGFPHSAKPFRDIYPLLVRLFVIKNFENSFLFVITFRSTAERAPSGPQWSRDPDTDVINRVPETTLAVNSELPEASCCRESGSPFRQSSFSSARLDRIPEWKQNFTPWFCWARAISVSSRLFRRSLGISSEKADVPSHFFSPLWGQCEGRLKACSKCDEFFFLFSSIAISSSVRVLYVQTNISADPGLPPAVSIASVTKSFRLLSSNATSCSVRVLYVWTDISANPGLSRRQSSERVDQWESLRLGSPDRTILRHIRAAEGGL